MPKQEQERQNLMFQAQQCDDQAVDLRKRADGLEFTNNFPAPAQKLRDAAANLTDAADSIRAWLRNNEE